MSYEVLEEQRYSGEGVWWVEGAGSVPLARGGTVEPGPEMNASGGGGACQSDSLN